MGYISAGLIIPPLPRYLFAGCCASKKDTAKMSLSTTTLIGSCLMSLDCATLSKKNLPAVILANFHVLDSSCVTNCERTSYIENRPSCLKLVTAADGMHCLAEGMDNFVKSCKAVLSEEARRLIRGANHSRAGRLFHPYRLN
jgi:hypothetical protein